MRGSHRGFRCFSPCRRTVFEKSGSSAFKQALRPPKIFFTANNPSKNPALKNKHGLCHAKPAGIVPYTFVRFENFGEVKPYVKAFYRPSNSYLHTMNNNIQEKEAVVK